MGFYDMDFLTGLVGVLLWLRVGPYGTSHMKIVRELSKFSHMKYSHVIKNFAAEKNFAI